MSDLNNYQVVHHTSGTFWQLMPILSLLIAAIWTITLFVLLIYLIRFIAQKVKHQRYNHHHGLVKALHSSTTVWAEKVCIIKELGKQKGFRETTIAILRNIDGVITDEDPKQVEIIKDATNTALEQINKHYY